MTSDKSSKNPDDRDPKAKRRPPTMHEITDLGDVPLDEGAERVDADDHIDIGHLPPSEGGSSSKSNSRLSGPLSGASVVSWTELMDGNIEDEAARALDALDFDADEDRDILSKALQNEPPSDSKLPSSSAASEDFIDLALPINKTKREQGSAASNANDSILQGLSQTGGSSAISGTGDNDSSQVNLLGDLGSGALSSGELFRQAEQDDLAKRSSADDVADIGSSPNDHIDSSAVDLGSHSAIDLPYPAAIGSSAIQEREARQAESGDSGAMDLLGDMAGSSVPGITAIKSDLKRDSAMPSTARVQTGLRGKAGSLVGPLLGVMTGMAICTGLWLAGVLPGKGDAAKPIPLAAQRTIGATIESGQALIDAGDFDKALDQLEKLDKTPDVNAALGQAYWLLYMKNCRAAGKPPAVDAKEAKQAQTALQESELPHAVLWLGLIEESVGNVEAAKKIYGDGLTKFQGQAEPAKMFRAAINRLDTKPASAANRSTANPALGMALFVLLQQGAPKYDEAGFKFWEALTLAKKHDYAGASAALKAAKDAHDVRRFLANRKGLNPASDPLEEIFLRSCDELLAYWKVREQINSGGYALAQYPSVNSAIGTLLTNAKSSNAELKKLQNTLLAVQAAVTQAKIEGNDLPGAFQKLVNANEALEKQRAEAVKAAESTRDMAKGEITKANADRNTAEAKLNQAHETAKTLEAELVKTRDQLSAMKTGTPTNNASADIAKLQQEQKDLQTKLTTAIRESSVLRDSMADLKNLAQAVREKLQTPADARPAEVVVALDRLMESKPPVRSDLPGMLPGAYAIDPRAEQSFAQGLTRYRQGEYGEAAKALQSAIRFNDRDARYWYMLGLAKVGQGDSDRAQADFRQGVELEKRNLPNPGVVNRGMERLPNDARATINRFRGA